MPTTPKPLPKVHAGDLIANAKAAATKLAGINAAMQDAAATLSKARQANTGSGNGSGSGAAVSP